MKRPLLSISIATFLMLAGAAATVAVIPAARSAAAANAAEFAELLAATLRREQGGPGTAPAGPTAKVEELTAAPLVAASADAHVHMLSAFQHATAASADLRRAVAAATPDTLPTLAPIATRTIHAEQALKRAIDAAQAIDTDAVDAARRRDAPAEQVSWAMERALLPQALDRLARMQRELPATPGGPSPAERALRDELQSARAENAALTAALEATRAAARAPTPTQRRELETLENALTMERDRNGRAEQIIANLRAEAQTAKTAQSNAEADLAVARGRVQTMQQQIAEVTARAGEAGTCIQCLRDRLAELERALAASRVVSRTSAQTPNPAPGSSNQRSAHAPFVPTARLSR